MMKRPNVMVQIVVATWICSWWSGIIIAFGLGLGIKYSNVSFNTEYAKDITEKRYESFIQSLREELSSGRKSHDIPVLRTASEAVGIKEFVYATLHNDAGLSITFALSALNAYVVAYQVNGGQNRCYFFKEFPAKSKALVFKQCHEIVANLSSSYGELGNREKIQLGFVPLSQCLHSFENFNGTGNNKDLRKGLLVVIQMVAEAARFKYIQQKMVAKGFLPGDDIITRENAWSDISTKIQNSIQLDEVKNMGLLLGLKNPLKKLPKDEL